MAANIKDIVNEVNELLKQAFGRGKLPKSRVINYFSYYEF